MILVSFLTRAKSAINCTLYQLHLDHCAGTLNEIYLVMLERSVKLTAAEADADADADAGTADMDRDTDLGHGTWNSGHSRSHSQWRERGQSGVWQSEQKGSRDQFNRANNMPQSKVGAANPGNTISKYGIIVMCVPYARARLLIALQRSESV